MPPLVARRLLAVVAIAAGAAIVFSAGPALAQADAAQVSALLREVKNPDFERANAAVAELRKHHQHRGRIVAGLIDALRSGEWSRCSGDMRDTIARDLGELKAKDAVGPLLELVKTGKSIEHECAE